MADLHFPPFFLLPIMRLTQNETIDRRLWILSRFGGFIIRKGWKIIINFNVDLDLRLTFKFKFLQRCLPPIIFNNLEPQSSITIRKEKCLENGEKESGQVIERNSWFIVRIPVNFLRVLLNEKQKIEKPSDHKFSLLLSVTQRSYFLSIKPLSSNNS